MRRANAPHLITGSARSVRLYIARVWRVHLSLWTRRRKDRARHATTGRLSRHEREASRGTTYVLGHSNAFSATRIPMHIRHVARRWRSTEAHQARRLVSCPGGPNAFVRLLPVVKRIAAESGIMERLNIGESRTRHTGRVLVQLLGYPHRPDSSFTAQPDSSSTGRRSYEASEHDSRPGRVPDFPGLRHHNCAHPQSTISGFTVLERPATCCDAMCGHENHCA